MSMYLCKTFTSFRNSISPEKCYLSFFDNFSAVKRAKLLTCSYVSSELWNDELQSRKKRKDPFSPDKKKPVVVSDILLLKSLFFLVAFIASLTIYVINNKLK